MPHELNELVPKLQQLKDQFAFFKDDEKAVFQILENLRQKIMKLVEKANIATTGNQQVETIEAQLYLMIFHCDHQLLGNIKIADENFKSLIQVIDGLLAQIEFIPNGKPMHRSSFFEPAQAGGVLYKHPELPDQQANDGDLKKSCCIIL